MGFKRIKTVIAAAWMLAVILLGIVLQTTTGGSLFVLAALGVVPPLVMWLLWNAPPETMSESIHRGTH
jgi:hypothetical protein